MKKRLALYLLFATSMLTLLLACSPDDGITHIRVNTVLPDRSGLRTDSFPLPNCNGNLEITQTLSDSISIAKEVKVEQVAVSRNGSEYTISEVEQLQFEVEVENAYKGELEIARSRLEKALMTVGPEKSATFTIQWDKVVYQSEVEFAFRDEVYQVPYVYELTIPKIIHSEEIDCLGEVPTNIPSIISTKTLVNSTAIVIKPVVYLRAGPSTTYATVKSRSIHENETVYVIARVVSVSTDNDWFLVETLDGLQGWLYTKWIELAVPITSIPIVTPLPTSLPPTHAPIPTVYP